MAELAEVGSLDWGRATGGRLTAGERRALRWAALRDARVYARSRLLLAIGRGSRRGSVDLDVLDLPDSALCRAVEAAASERQSPQLLGHAYRTVAYAHVVAAIDRVELDPELLWCASLLHDVELEHPVPGRCFAARGGATAEQVALDAGVDAATARALGDAVCRHATPDLDPAAHPLPYLVAAGALVDVVGKRLDEMDRAFVQELQRAHPRADVAKVLRSAWRAEVRAVPDGRAALAERTVLFSLAARLAPSR
ncbi:MAG: hypothetical protein U0P45_04185 [Acidimicrobiales bacterium]